jgi:flagellar motor switch protein FliN/FliY
MANPMPNPLVEAFCEALSEVLSRTAGSALTFNVLAQEPSKPSHASKWFELKVSGGRKGLAAIGLSDAAIALLTRQEPAEVASGVPEAAVAVLQGFVKEVSTAAGTRLQEEMGQTSVQAKLSQTPFWPGSVVAIGATQSGSEDIVFLFRISPELQAGQQMESSPEETLMGESAASPSNTVSGDAQTSLLLGVELNLTLRFGQSVLSLKEILELGSGSIVELDRQVQEPADLLLGDKVIARGEVVVVDGNYGIRITEVAAPQERMTSAQ